MARPAVVLDVAQAVRPGAVPASGEQRRRRPWATPAALLGLMALSAVLRTTELNLGFWIDEGLSVGIADRALTEIPETLRQDGSPPLYYLVLHVWMAVFGRGEIATHVLSLVFALATVPVAWWAARGPFGDRAAWMAAAGAATVPFLTQYAQETRMYTLVVLLGTFATGAFLRAFVERRPRWWAAFALAFAALLYTHNWVLFLGAATGVAWLTLVAAAADGAPRRALAREGLLAFGLVALLYLPWLPSMLYQAAHTGAPWARPPSLETLTTSFGRLLGMDAQYVLLLCAGAGLVALLRPLRHGLRRLDGDGRAALALLVIGLGTLGIAALASLVSPAWAYRYLAVAVAPLVLVSALGLARAGALGLVGAALVLVMWMGDGPPDEKSNARVLSAAVAPSLRPGDVVVATHPETTPVLAYYLPDGLRFATLWGPVEEVGVTDWRDGVERIARTSAARDLEPLIAGLRPGQRLVLVQPIIYSLKSWMAPWTELVRYRSLEWERAIEQDRRLRIITRRPFTFRPPAPNPLAASVYERVRAPGP